MLAKLVVSRLFLLMQLLSICVSSIKMKKIAKHEHHVQKRFISNYFSIIRTIIGLTFR